VILAGVGWPASQDGNTGRQPQLGCCRRHGINPDDYLKDLFTRLSAAKITEIGQFMPRAWAMENAQAKLTTLAA